MNEHMKVKQIASNMTEVIKIVEDKEYFGKYYILVSYQTPVVVIAFVNGKQSVYINKKYYSKTTTTHINKYLKNEWNFKDSEIKRFPRVDSYQVLNASGQATSIIAN